MSSHARVESQTIVLYTKIYLNLDYCILNIDCFIIIGNNVQFIRTSFVLFSQENYHAVRLMREFFLQFDR
jgi:hypothetical protein